jgi:hypothetical protein
VRHLGTLAASATLALPVPAAWSNYSHHHRSASSVRLVVVHVTEGSYRGTIRWFRNPRARASANYVVGRDGRVAHMVPDSDVAWHAGNGWVNAHSIGIEHEGYAELDGTFTDAEYRASAHLLATLLRRYHLPADRGHVIGHNEVPDPNRRGFFGGFAHHTDPGAFWDWPRYMTYTRDYLAGRTPPPRPLDVTVPGLALGQVVTGLYAWTAVATGETPAYVDFLVDGDLRATIDTEPFTYGWDTGLEKNGRHVLTARAVGDDGREAVATVVVTSHASAAPPPPPPPIVTLAEPVRDAVVSGVVPIEPELAGGPVTRIELWIDGVLTQTTDTAPWTLLWDTTAVAAGPHTLAVRAVGERGRAAAVIVPLTVQAPPPAPLPAPAG